MLGITEALTDLMAIGGRVQVEGEDVRIICPSDPPAELMERLQNIRKYLLRCREICRRIAEPYGVSAERLLETLDANNIETLVIADAILGVLHRDAEALAATEKPKIHH